MPDPTAFNQTPQRILIVRPSALGDVARTVPALVSLRHAFPDATIDWLVRDDFAQVIAAHPALNHVIPFPRKDFDQFGRNWQVTRTALAFLRDLRRSGYDRVYDLQGLFRSGLMSRVTGAPWRVGFADARELAWLGYNRRHRIERTPHTVDKMIRLLEMDGIPPIHDLRLYVPKEDQEWANRFLRENHLSPERYAVIAPTTRWLSKNWPVEHFVQVLHRLPRLGFKGCIIVGSPGDVALTRPLIEPRTRDWPVIDLVGRTGIGQLMAVLERCGLLICNDSAALHIATGLGRRSVSIFGPTDPAEVGPYRYDRGVVQAQADRRVRYRQARLDQSLIGSVTVDQVWQRVEEVLNAPPPCPDPTEVSARGQ